MKRVICIMSVLLIGATYDGLKAAFPDATVRAAPGAREKSEQVTISFPARGAMLAKSDPQIAVAEFMQAHAQLFNIHGKCRVERSHEGNRGTEVVRLYDQIGEARVAGSQIIAHVLKGEITWMTATIPTASLSGKLRSRALKIRSDPVHARNAVLDDMKEQSGVDPRSTGQFRMWPEKIEQIPVELVVDPSEETLLYQVSIGNKIWSVDAETFEIIKRPSEKWGDW